MVNEAPGGISKGGSGFARKPQLMPQQGTKLITLAVNLEELRKVKAISLSWSVSTWRSSKGDASTTTQAVPSGSRKYPIMAAQKNRQLATRHRRESQL